MATVGALWTWGIILVAHLGYRRAVAEGRAAPSKFRMPGSPVMNWVSLGFILLITAFLALDADARIALYIAPVCFGLLAIGYRLSKVAETVTA